MFGRRSALVRRGPAGRQAFVERIERGDVRVVESEVEDGGVLGDALRVRGAREDDELLLQGTSE